MPFLSKRKSWIPETSVLLTICLARGIQCWNSTRPSCLMINWGRSRTSSIFTVNTSSKNVLSRTIWEGKIKPGIPSGTCKSMRSPRNKGSKSEGISTTRCTVGNAGTWMHTIGLEINSVFSTLTMRFGFLSAFLCGRITDSWLPDKLVCTSKVNFLGSRTLGLTSIIIAIN